MTAIQSNVCVLIPEFSFGARARRAPPSYCPASP
jgi:hypothetical protein